MFAQSVVVGLELVKSRGLCSKSLNSSFVRVAKGNAPRGATFDKWGIALVPQATLHTLFKIRTRNSFNTHSISAHRFANWLST
jgi:hypothetical protein